MTDSMDFGHWDQPKHRLDKQEVVIEQEDSEENYDNAVASEFQPENHVPEVEAFESDSKLVAFFYHLMRDHLPAGTVEKLVREATRPTVSRYTNTDLAKYADKIAGRLS